MGTSFDFDWSTSALVTVGSAAEERARLGQLMGRDSTAGFLLRTPSTLTGVLAGPRAAAARPALLLLAPEAVLVRNSALATPRNDGALWAGRGASLLLRGGAAGRAGRFVAVLAPEVTYAQNLGYQSTAVTLGGQTPATGAFAAPWFTGPYSADLPLRFGDQAYATVGWGQSAVYVEAGPVAAGFSSENQWWGPGVRNALLLSNAAEGVMHAFVRTRRPLRTRLGDVEGRWILGGLTPSLYFDPPSERSEGRALSGAVVTLRVRGQPGLTVGVARVVVAPVRSSRAIAGHAFDVLFRNDDLGGDTLRTTPHTDQLASLFARWVFAGAEVYGEFARSELPRSPRDFLLAPLNTGAYTLGLARAWRVSAAGELRAGLEVSNLEQSRAFTDRALPPDYYTGRAAPAGFTNRGQVLGAAIGPGSQGQWAAVDYYTPRWHAGAFAERVRNQNDALYRQFLPTLCRHDVTLGGGVRGGVRLPALDVSGSAGASNRLNYLFQSGCANYFGLGTVDVRNVSLTLTLSPRASRGRR